MPIAVVEAGVLVTGIPVINKKYATATWWNRIIRSIFAATKTIIMKKMLLSVSMICFLAISSLLLSCNNDTSKTDSGKTDSGKTDSGKTGASGTALNLDSAKAVINASNKEYSSCFASGDSVKFAGFYTSDACLNPPNMPRMCGSKAIMSFLAMGTKMGIKGVKLTVDEVMGSEAALAEIGHYDLMGDKNVSLDKGKYIVVWKMVDGKWKMHRDEWNSDMPAAK